MKSTALTKESLRKVIFSARGEEPLDTKLRGGNVVSVFTGELFQATVGIKNGLIATLEAEDLEAKKTIDLNGAVISPSFIDAHIHIESSMMTPERFAEAVVPRGTGAVVSDPHEIANVLGAYGVFYMKKASMGLPIDIHINMGICGIPNIIMFKKLSLTPCQPTCLCTVTRE